MSFPLMPNPASFRPTPTVTFLTANEGGFGTSVSMGADDPERYLMLTIAYTGTNTSTCSIEGVSTPVWYPQSDGTINNTSGGTTAYAVARVPTGSTVSFSFSGNGQTALYKIIGLESTIPTAGCRDSGNPASDTIIMQENGIIFANGYADNDNNGFTWSSPMIRTVNNTSYGASRGATAAYYPNTPSGSYRVSVSMGIGSINMGAAVFR
jgi:hypothetical protein